MQSSAPVEVWRSVRALPDFWRLLQVRVASHFGDGLFQAALAGALENVYASVEGMLR